MLRYQLLDSLEPLDRHRLVPLARYHAMDGVVEQRHLLRRHGSQELLRKHLSHPFVHIAQLLLLGLHLFLSIA